MSISKLTQEGAEQLKAIIQKLGSFSFPWPDMHWSRSSSLLQGLYMLYNNLNQGLSLLSVYLIGDHAGTAGVDSVLTMRSFAEEKRAGPIGCLPRLWKSARW